MRDEKKCLIKYVTCVDENVMESYLCDFSEAINMLDIIKRVDYITIKGKGEDFDGDWRVIGINLCPAKDSVYLQVIDVVLDYEEC